MCGFGGRAASNGWRCRGCWGGGYWVGWLVRLVDTAPPPPTRSPPWRGIRFALPCRRIRAGLRRSGSRCRLLSCGGLLRGHALTHLDMNGGARKNPRYGAEATPRVPIRNSAITADWRMRRGSACVASGFKPLRPPLQAEPFDAAPCRGFFRAPPPPIPAVSADRAPPPQCPPTDCPLAPRCRTSGRRP